MSVYYITRKIYLTRRLLNNTFEKDPIRIDIINNEDMVINWGNIVKEINYRNYDINNFNISPITLCISNKNGNFYDENRISSLWNGFLTRIYSKIDIVAGESENNLENIYYGIIDNIKNTYDKKTYIIIQPPEYILNKFNIKNLNLSGKIICEKILEKILNQKTIKLFIENYSIDLEIKNITVNETENLSGSYWEIIKYICLITNSYVYFEKKILKIIPKTGNAGDTNIVLYSQHKSSGGKDTIYSIGNFDDEGHKKIRLRFQDTNSKIFVVSKNYSILDKYLGLTDSVAETESVDLVNIKESDKEKILNILIDYWSKPKKSIEITTKFNNKLKLLKIIKLDIKDKNQSGVRWGHFYWDSGQRWGSIGGGFVIFKTTKWIIKSLIHDLTKWTSKINLEEF